MAADTFESADLARRYAEVLEAVRTHGEARLHDSGGITLAIVPDDGLRELRELAAAAMSFLTVEQAIKAMGATELSLDDLGDWQWVRHLPHEDFPLFLDEIRRALLGSLRDGRPELLREELRAWHETAEALADPLRRETLLTKQFDPGDYIEVGRPE